MSNFSNTTTYPFGIPTTQSGLLGDRSIYQRDPTIVGNDLIIAPQGDIQTTERGDLSLITGSEGIIQNLLRRMTTPPDGYARWIRDLDGIKTVDENYENGAYSYLSSPLSLNDPAAIRQAVITAGEGDPRINVRSVDVDTDYRGNIDIRVQFTIKGNQELQTVSSTLLSRLVN